MKKLFCARYHVLVKSMLLVSLIANLVIADKKNSIASNVGDFVVRDVTLRNDANKRGEMRAVKGIEIVGYTGSATELVIPTSVDNVAVVSIGDEAFKGKGLTSVRFDLAEGLTTLGTLAFADNELTNVIIPDSITTIGERTFAENPLIGVTLGTGVKTVGEATFADYQLMNVTSEATTPPKLIGVDGNIMPPYATRIARLYVPRKRLKVYKRSSWAQFFKDILPIS